nr:complement factor H-like isoform X3 [Misgurnus anguillicaudatus]
MRVPLKLFSFSFGIFFLTFAQGQEKKESCTTPIIRNGKIHRDSSEKDIIYYSCNLGYKPYFGNWWGAAMCANGIWINEPRCIRVDECRAFPSILHGQLNIEQSVVEVKCDPGFKSSHTVIICINGTWQTPTCESLCSKPLQIVNNAILIDQIQSQRKYSHGDTAHYECVEDYESNEQTIAKCDVQTWIYPECIKKAQCTKPTINLQFVTLLDEKNTFNNFDVLRYTCNKPYDKIPNGTLICKAGKWNSTFDCTSSICPPPPMIEDGDFNIEQKTGEVITEVSYLCQSYFVLDKPNNYRCLDGIWETPPKCLKPCKITPDIYKEYNIKPILDDYIRHSAEEVRLDCNDGWTVGGFSRQSYSKALCYDGELRIENKCTEENFFG